MSAEKKRKSISNILSKRNIIIATTIIVLLAIISLVLLWPSNEEGEGENGGSPGSSSPGATEQPSPTEEGTIQRDEIDDDMQEWWDSFTPSTTPTATPTAPTTFRGSGVHGAIPIDPEFGAPDRVAEYGAKNLFSIAFDGNSSWSKSFEENKAYMTRGMQDRGFQKWWLGDEESHELTWRINDNPGSFISATSKAGNAQWIAEDTALYNIRVSQTLNTSSGMTNLPEFTVVITMKFEDDKWLMDNYDFPNGIVPSLH